MKQHEREILFTSWLAATLSVIILIVVLELSLFGQPPRHCHYLVQVKDHPGILACSEYPRRLTKP